MSNVLDRYEALVAAGELRPDREQRRAAERLNALQQALEATPKRGSVLWRLAGKAPEPPRGVYMWGGVGRGKSMLMDLFHDCLRIQRKRRVHFHEFMLEVHARLRVERQKEAGDPIVPVAEALVGEARLLAFDEMVVNNSADAMIMSRLFTAMMARGLTVVATSNRAPKDLYKDGLNRAIFLPFIAMLEERLDVVELESPTDYRQHRLQGAQVYFHPARTATAQIAAIWTDLTGGATEQPLVLEVNGRQVSLPRFANGVGRASFWDLCSKPLGPADYLAIARAVRVLILEDIPQLSSANYNEAKRFVTLIDALYEARVRLIASAAESPERLYIEGEGSFEFERTASRLREMQGADWGL